MQPLSQIVDFFFKTTDGQDMTSLNHNTEWQIPLKHIAGVPFGFVICYLQHTF